MANQRLINCDFFIKGGFDNQTSNNAKLLYFYLIINADDMGFVGNADKIIKDLNEDLANDDPSLLFKLKFENAADELVERGLCYRFYDKHQNQTLLIRHWFTHNKKQKFLTTNFLSYLAMVDLIGNCYEMKNSKVTNEIESTKPKETNSNENNKDWEKEWEKTLKELSKPIGDDNNEIH